LREFGEHCSPPQKRVALASATLSDSSIPKIAFGDFPRASSIPLQSSPEHLSTQLRKRATGQVRLVYGHSDFNRLEIELYAAGIRRQAIYL
jgi:hypothetical protein